MKKPPEIHKKSPSAESGGPLQVVARNLARWMLMLSVGMGGMSGVAFYFGLWAEGAMLLSIFLVSGTLYYFIKLWPDEEEKPAPQPAPDIPVVSPKPARLMVAAVHVDGPPKIRCVMALRDMVRRQESFQISQQGAEAFAKTIRFMLRSQS